MQQHIDAAGGSDPYVCFKAVEECKHIEKDEKGDKDSGMANTGFGAMQFKRTRSSVGKRGSRTGRAAAAGEKGRRMRGDKPLAPPLRFKYVRPSIPPPANLIPETFEPRDRMSPMYFNDSGKAT